MMKRCAKSNPKRNCEEISQRNKYKRHDWDISIERKSEQKKNKEDGRKEIEN